MIERIAEVIGQREGQVQLRVESAACRGCESGCGGRCQFLPIASDGVLWLRHSGASACGQRVALGIDDAALARAAWRGYGHALAGLLAGATLGAGVGSWLLPESWRDAATLLGLLAGTFLAARLSKRHRIAPQLRWIAPAPHADDGISSARPLIKSDCP